MMQWLRSGARPFLEPELEEWQLEAWRWLLGRLGGVPALLQATLVTPTRDFFPPTDATGHARVEHVFEQVKRHADMADWRCRLAAQPRQPELRLGEFVAVRRSRPDPAGTFGLKGNEPAITYDPAAAKDPMVLVAVLAHELAHLLLATLPDALPGGRDANERMTDLATVAMGFGLFGSNCAFGFERFHGPVSQGWSWSRLGYLEEREWAFALAVQFELTGREAAAVRRYLKPHLFTDFRTALGSLRRRPELLVALREAGPSATW